MRSKRFEALAKRPVNQDGFVKEWIEEGFIAMESPNDPKPSIKIVNGAVTELDGKPVSDFDLIDHFIARYGINLNRAEEVMAMDSVKLANMLCDPNVKRSEIVPLTTAMTPAKIVEVVSHMNVVEMMMAMQKMRARRTPSQQAHVTNVKDNPVQIAADAAEGAWRGFDEQETTVAVARYAPFNAIALLVGSQVGRPGVLTQCSLEEATELKLGMLGHLLRRNHLRLRYRTGLYRRRRHAVVEGFLSLLLRLSRSENALHLRLRLRSADGLRRRQIHALPGSALHLHHQSRGRTGPAKRFR